MNGRGSRAKGQRAEREFAALMTELGVPMKRNTEGSRGQLDGDQDNDHDLYVEVRRRENQSIAGWLSEVEEKKGKRIGILATRFNHQPWVVHMTPEQFAELVKE